MPIQQPLLQVCSLLFISSTALHGYPPPHPISFGVTHHDIQDDYHQRSLYICELRFWLSSLKSSGLWIPMLCYVSCQSRKKSLFPIMCHMWTPENQACCCEKSNWFYVKGFRTEALRKRLRQDWVWAMLEVLPFPNLRSLCSFCPQNSSCQPSKA